MSENDMKYRGLCSSCKNFGYCDFQKDRQKPALYCEEFEVDICPSVKTTGKNKLPAITSVEVEDSDKFTGLCRDCDSRRTCVFPKPQGGIWHCEEYK